MQIIQGDCLEVLKSLPEHSVDALVADPPAGIAFMGKDWDKDKGGRDTWIAWLAGIMTEARRVIKPGGHAFIWALPRTSHWTALALENAGWEIREKHYHVFGSGFPKSHNISKAIDRHFQAEREVLGHMQGSGIRSYQKLLQEHGARKYAKGLSEDLHKDGVPLTAPATPEATQWDGWGTATKPAAEEWILARAPLAEKSIAENVLRWGTGGLNIDATRIAHNEPPGKPSIGMHGKSSGIMGDTVMRYRETTAANINGRFPSNFLISHSLFCTEDQCIDDCPVAVLDRQSGISPSNWRKNKRSGVGSFSGKEVTTHSIDDAGGASRYFQTFYYCPKPSKRERNSGCDELPERTRDVEHWNASCKTCGCKFVQNGQPVCGHNNVEWIASKPMHNHHPTVKPAQLMQYLCKLITPPGGTVLDPFAGSGTTGVACIQEGFDFIGIEREPEYIEIARARIEYARKLHAEK